MRNLLDRYLPVFNNDGGSGGGGSGGDQGGDKGGGDQGGDKGGGDQGGDKGGGDQGGDKGGPKLHRPKGMPETMYGDTNEETIDKLLASNNGFRQKFNDLPKRPETAAEYTLTDLSDNVAPYFKNFQSDPAFATVAAAAHENDITQDQFQGFLTAIVGEWQKTGILSPVLDVGEERKKLLPVEAQYLTAEEQEVEIDKRMKDNISWIENLGGKHGIKEDMGEWIIENLGDAAYGHQFIELFRRATSRMTRPLVADGDAGGDDIDAIIDKRMADARNKTTSPAFDKAFRAKTDEMIKQKNKST